MGKPHAADQTTTHARNHSLHAADCRRIVCGKRRACVPGRKGRKDREAALCSVPFVLGAIRSQPTARARTVMHRRFASFHHAIRSPTWLKPSPKVSSSRTKTCRNSSSIPTRSRQYCPSSTRWHRKRALSPSLNASELTLQRLGNGRLNRKVPCNAATLPHPPACDRPELTVVTPPGACRPCFP